MLPVYIPFPTVHLRNLRPNNRTNFNRTKAAPKELIHLSKFHGGGTFELDKFSTSHLLPRIEWDGLVARVERCEKPVGMHVQHALPALY